MGLSFVVPEGWLGSIPEDSDAFVMGSETQPGVIIALTHGAETADELVENLADPMPLDEGVTLHAQGRPVVEPPWVKVAILVTNGTGYLPGYLMALVRADGPGALYIGFGQGAPQLFQRLVSGMAASTQTSAPRPDPGTPETQQPLPLLRGRGGPEVRLGDTPAPQPQDLPLYLSMDKPEDMAERRSRNTPGDAPSDASKAQFLVQQWLKHLGGKKVSFLESYSSGASGGYSIRRDYYLCSDGRFVFRESNSAAIYVPGASASSGGLSSGEGRWRVLAQGEQAVLELTWSDGRVAQRLLEYDGSRTFIDGERWYVTEENDMCG
jgi:hypothetical protein